MKTQFITFKDGKQIDLLTTKNIIPLSIENMVTINDDIYEVYQVEYNADENIIFYYLSEGISDHVLQTLQQNDN